MSVRTGNLALRPVARPKPGHEADALGLEPPEREFERSQRGWVAPLQVVERDEERALQGQLANPRDQGEVEPERVDRPRLVRIDPAQSDIECSRLRSGQVELRGGDRFE